MHAYGLTCGSKTRAGTPCKLTIIYGNGRCKLHGGLSTGPLSEAGKAQARINGKKGGRPRKNIDTASPETEPHENGNVSARVGKVQTRSAELNNTAENLPADAKVLQRDGKVSIRVKSDSAAGQEFSALLLEDRQNHEQPQGFPKGGEVSSGSLHRCADCGNLSAGFTCLAAACGEIEGGSGYRPDPGEQRRCPAFIEQETWRD